MSVAMRVVSGTAGNGIVGFLTPSERLSLKVCFPLPVQELVGPECA